MVEVDAVQAGPTAGHHERTDHDVVGAHDHRQVRGADLDQRHPRRRVRHLGADEEDQVRVGRAGGPDVGREPVDGLGCDVGCPPSDVLRRRTARQRVGRPHGGVVDQRAGPRTGGRQGDREGDAQAAAPHDGDVGPDERGAAEPRPAGAGGWWQVVAAVVRLEGACGVEQP